MSYKVLMRNHGGECCGISHVMDFCINPTDSDFKYNLDMIKELQEESVNKENGTGVMLEVVLADFQFKLWRPELLKLGFKEVTRFVNDNSNNTCAVFHYVHQVARRPIPRT